MADLNELQRFAEEHNFALTTPLKHAQVVNLAQRWVPDLRFFEREKFFPISLDQAFSMIDDVFRELQEPERNEWRVGKIIRTGESTGEVRLFDPPVVHKPNGTASFLTLSDGTVVPGLWPIVGVISNGDGAHLALGNPGVNSDTVTTHGASFTRSDRFFGAQRTLTVEDGVDPFLPRATTAGGEPLITVFSSLVNLVELLKYELLISETFDDNVEENDYPPDGMRGEFDIARLLVSPTGPFSPPLPFPTLRRFLLDTIAALETGSEAPAPPSGWRLNRRPWNLLTTSTFLEYYFFYPYNDFNRHETALFANEHEGDDEGCCLVFDRNALAVAATANDPNALLRVVPQYIITSVHEENQNADKFKSIDPPVSIPADKDARDLVPFTAYVAAGSHATYLTEGQHDLVDFQDYLAQIEENPFVLLVPGLLVTVLILLSIIEHFTDTEDETSDNGVRIGPDDIVGDHPNAVSKEVIVIPNSADNHVYQSANVDLLRLRGYAGKWGGHNEVINKSPSFKSKTGRFFRRLLSKA